MRASLNREQLRSLLADHAMNNSNSEQNLQNATFDINEFKKSLMNKS